MSTKNETNVSIEEKEYKEFAERFQMLFDGMNASQIGAKVGITHVTAGNYLDGKRLPTPDVLKKIVAVTDVSLNWLLTGEGEMKIDKQRKLDALPREKKVEVTQKIHETLFNKQMTIDDLLDEKIRAIVREELERQELEKDRLTATVRMRLEKEDTLKGKKEKDAA